MDLEKLRYIISESGLKKQFIAKEIGISNQCLYNKLNGKSEFSVSEIRALRDILSLTEKQAKQIFLE